jgi:gamma-glutamyltranspeptidase/glutathione hydrolase
MQYNFKYLINTIMIISIFFFYSCNDNKNVLLGDNGMVSSAHPIASQVGIKILKNGGNAFDAAIGVQFALSVVYPNAGNIGGGGFAVYRLNNGNVGSLDFREKAPGKATRNMYLDDNNEVYSKKSKLGHLASGIPGSVDGMVKLHEKFGLLDWKNILEPSILLSKNGFQLSKNQALSLNNVKESFLKLNDSSISLINNDVWKKNDLLVQNNLYKTLKRIQNNKRDGFYSGKTADLLLNEMNQGNGIFTLEDLKNYSSIWREPIIGNYKNHKIISMGPPSSGGIALVQMLNGAEKLNINKYEHNSKNYIHMISEIESRVYADRATYLGDPDFFEVPSNTLMSNKYLENKFRTILLNKKTASSDIKEGQIEMNETEETTHFSIVDKFGNAVSITTTINGSYGSKVVVDGAGFLLNNEMDDFSIKPGFPNMFGLTGGEVNAIEGNKRMLSSMTPTIIEKEGKLFMVLGTPGGSTIITSVFQTILNVIDYKMTMQEAVDSKKFHHQWLPDLIVIEKKTINNDIKDALIQMGHKFNERTSIGRMDCILVNEAGKLEGAADKRGDNIAIGY